MPCLCQHDDASIVVINDIVNCRSFMYRAACVEYTTCSHITTVDRVYVAKEALSRALRSSTKLQLLTAYACLSGFYPDSRHPKFVGESASRPLSLFLPSSSLFCPLLSLSPLPFPFLPLDVGPLNPARRSVERCKLPNGS